MDNKRISMEKQDFTIIKEKIIKTNELLVLFNEKNEKLNKAKHAFKQLKAKYEEALNETNRLKMDNERLNDNIERSRPKHEQNEKELVELRADYTRTDERYQQTMIESQLTISDLEEKLKHCTCEKKLPVSPGKRRNPNDRVKEIKRMYQELQDIETNLRNDNDNLKFKNKELKMERVKNLRVIEDLSVKNANLENNLLTVKNEMQEIDLSSKHQANLELNIVSLKEAHEKEIGSLKMEISKLSLDNQEVKYLKIKCKNLEEKVNSRKILKIKKLDCCAQTEDTLENDFTNVEKVIELEGKCKKLEKKLSDFKDTSIQMNIPEPMQTLKVYEDDSLNFDNSIGDIFREMILPKALSPLSFLSRIDSPTPPLLNMLSEDLSQQTPFVQKDIPNIVITPPTPGVELGSPTDMVFPLITGNLRRENLSQKKIVEDKEEIIREGISVSKIQSSKNLNKKEIMDYEQLVSNEKNTRIDTKQISCSEIAVAANNEQIKPDNSAPAFEEKVIFKLPAIPEKNVLPKLVVSGVMNQELLQTIKVPSNENRPSDEKKNNSTTTTTNLVSNYNKTASTEEVLEPLKTDLVCARENLKSASVNLESLDLKDNPQRRRKFWLPYNMNAFVKIRKKHTPLKVARRKLVTRKHGKILSTQPAQNDTILNALKTLQENNINFTISNESIPLVQPYSYYSLLTPPKTEPRSTSRKVSNTLTYSLKCWNKQCTANNSQMLLRKVPNEEEEELLGFFSVKDEIITPSVSRMTVVEQPKLSNEDDLVTRLLSGIKELVHGKRKKSLGNRRKRRLKSRNRRSDFYSETETELEQLFGKSADVLGRNKRFLAAARQGGFESNGESVFESESDPMVDSGLVTGTPKDDSDSLSCCSQNELDTFRPIISKDTLAPRLRSSYNVTNKSAFLNNEVPSLGNCTTSRFSSYPAMLSPIASSKGSPETLQGSSTPFKTPEFTGDLRESPECFKVPFCPVMISPLASLKGSPVIQTPKSMTDTNEDRFDCFKIPSSPPMVSPLASLSETPPENCSRNPVAANSSKRIDKYFPIRAGSMSVSNFQTQELNRIDDLRCSEIQTLSKNVNQVFTKDFGDIKPSSIGKKMSSICQRITFDSVAENEQFGQDVSPFKMDFKLKRSDSKNSNVLSATSIISSEHLAQGDSTTISNESSLHIDLSIQSSDLNYSFDDINISQLEVGDSVNAIVSKPNDRETPVDDPHLKKIHLSDCKQTCKRVENKRPKETVSITRYSLRGRSQCTEKQDSNLEWESQKSLSLVENPPVDFTFPRTRAAKRKFEEEEKNKGQAIGGSTRSFNSAKSEELAEPLKEKGGYPRNVNKITVPIEDKRLKGSQDWRKSPVKISDQKVDKPKLTLQEEEDIVKEMTSKNEFGSDSEEADISSKSDVSSFKQETVETCEDKGEEFRVRKSLKNRRRKSSNSSKDISRDLIDWMLDTDFKNVETISNQGFEEPEKSNKEITVTEVDSNKSLDSVKDIEMRRLEKRQSSHKSKKIISKEFISESESDSDNSVKIHPEGNQQACVGRPFETNISQIQQEQSNGNDCQESAMKTTLLKDRQRDISSKEGQSSGNSSLEMTRLKQSGYRLRNTSEEVITKSEGQSDTSLKVHIEAEQEQEHVIDHKQSQSGDNICQVPVLKEEGLSSSEKTSGGIKDKMKENEVTLGCYSGNNNSLQSNQAVTSEIKSILRNLTHETIRTSSFLLGSASKDQKEDIPAITGSSDAVHPSERDIFGDVSESEDEGSGSNNKRLKVTEKCMSKKVSAKQNLKKKILNQVKNTVYANSRNKVCDIIKKNCEDKVKEISKRTNVSKEKSESLQSVKKKEKKIKVFQNILISKGQAFNLLSNKVGAEQPNSTKLTVTKAPPPKEDPSRPYSRKMINMEQNISTTTSTPVDILSQVMQGMIKTGPKTARKNVNRVSLQSVQSNGAQERIAHGTVRRSWKVVKKLAEEDPVKIGNDDDYLDCPKSPDVIELPDRLPKLIPTEKPVRLQPSKVRALMAKLMVFSNEVKMLDDVIKEFAFQDMTFMAQIILDKVSHDYHDKADNSFPPSPPMTSTQRILLGFLLKLDRSTHPGIRDKFLGLAEQHLFSQETCRLEIVQPVTRLYTAVCKLNCELNRIRRFICEGFYFMEDFAVPMFFTLLTMWPEVLPMESETSDKLLAKVIIQVCYLKECTQPGYNLLPLRDLLKKYYGYPIERWNCEDVFREILIEYIRNPSIRLSDFTLLIFLRNKPTNWVHQKLKNTIIPLYHQVPESNPNLKATLLILIANICSRFKPPDDYDWSVILEMHRWFVEIDKDDLDPVIKRGIHLARCRLPRRLRIKKETTIGKNENAEDKKELDDTSESNCKGTQNCAEDVKLKESGWENCDDSFEIGRIKSLKEPNESTNNTVNVSSQLGPSSPSECGTKIDFLNNR